LTPQSQHLRTLQKKLAASSRRTRLFAAVSGIATLSFAVQFNLGPAASYTCFALTALAATFAWTLLVASLVAEGTADGRSQACWWSVYGAVMLTGMAGALNVELASGVAKATSGLWLMHSTQIALTALAIGGAVAVALELGKKAKES
jgi:hypothetical protein